MIEYNETLEKLDKELDEICRVWKEIYKYLEKNVSVNDCDPLNMNIENVKELTLIYLGCRGINSFKEFTDSFSNTKRPLSYKDFCDNYFCDNYNKIAISNKIAIRNLQNPPSPITQNFLDALIPIQYRNNDKLFEEKIKPLQNEDGSWKTESEEYQKFDCNLLMKQFDKKLNNVIKKYATERLKIIKHEIGAKTEEELKKDLQSSGLGYYLNLTEIEEEKLLKPILQDVDFNVKEPAVFSMIQSEPLLYFAQNRENIFSFLADFTSSVLKDEEFCKTLIAVEKGKIEKRRLEDENKKLKDELTQYDQKNMAEEFTEMWTKAKKEDSFLFWGIVVYYGFWLITLICYIVCNVVFKFDPKPLSSINDILIWLLPKVPFVALFWVGLVILNSKRKNAHNEYLYFAHLQKMLNGMIAYKQHGESAEVKEAYLINGMKHLTKSPIEGLEVKKFNEAKFLTQLNVLKQIKNLFK